MNSHSMKVLYRVNAAANDIRRAMDRAFEETGLSDVQWVILHVVPEASRRHGASPTVAEIAERMVRDSDLVRREIIKLEERGLVHVQWQDAPTSSVVTLTPHAERQLPALTIAAETVGDRAVNGLTNDEIETLNSLLDRIVENLE